MAIFVRGDMVANQLLSLPPVDAVREVEGEVRGDPPTGPGSTGQLLSATWLACRRGDHLHSVSDCLTCKRFVNFVPSPDRRRVTVRCSWSSTDAVADLMSLTDAVATVSPHAPLRVAQKLAERQGDHHLLVVDQDLFCGLLCTCDLLPPWADDRVADRMARQVWVTSPTSTLGNAAALMNQHHIGCLPVVASHTLVGLLTRTELDSAGLGELLIPSPAF